MNEIVTEHSDGVLRIELNRPAKRNAMTSSMYTTLADVFIDAAKDEAHACRALAWRGQFILRRQRYRGFPEQPSRARRLSAGSVDECAGRFRQADRRRRPRRGHRRRHDHADALRFRLRGRERQIPHALHRSRPGAGIWIELLASGEDRAHPRRGVDPVGSCPSMPGAPRNWDWSLRSRPIRTFWPRRPKRRGNWRRSRPARCGPARDS